MKRTALVLVVPLLFLVGCRSSTRTIDIHGGLFSIGEPAAHYAANAYTFSRDGSKMCTLKDMFSDSPTIQVVNREDGAVLAEYKVTQDSWIPLLFTDDGQGLVVVAQQSENLTAHTIKIGEDLPVPVQGENQLEFNTSNHDLTMMAGKDGLVLTNSGAIVHAVGAEGRAAFDQFGNAWYRTKNGKWVYVDKEGHAVAAAARPAYLVDDPQHHRGAMHLSDTQEDLEHENAHAFVTAVWLHHDKALGGVDERRNPRNLSALVYAGADVNDYMFVPGRNEVAVFDSVGTRFVPYSSDVRS